tara:strand:- start:212718 stop:213248 length:531 start_codon:yes stop_codon:yes gene_type:complete
MRNIALHDRNSAMQSPVPPLSHSLHALAAILSKAEAHCEKRNIEPSALLSARLFPDMFTFTRNVQVACDTAKGAAARLSQTEIPSHQDVETTFVELHARIQKTLDFIKSIPEAAFDGAEDRTVTLKMRAGDIQFTGSQYLSSFVTPQFYFHMTTAYNILRHNGVEIGKRDFLGKPE